MLDNIFIILMVPLLIIYPFIITRIIDKHTKKSKEITVKNVVIELLKIIAFSVITFFIICFLLEKYFDLMPSSKSSLCTNTGGWTYKCKGDYRTILMLLLMGSIITINHFLSQHSFYKICKFDNK